MVRFYVPLPVLSLFQGLPRPFIELILQVLPPPTQRTASMNQVLRSSLPSLLVHCHRDIIIGADNVELLPGDAFLQIFDNLPSGPGASWFVLLVDRLNATASDAREGPSGDQQIDVDVSIP